MKWIIGLMCRIAGIGLVTQQVVTDPVHEVAFRTWLDEGRLFMRLHGRTYVFGRDGHFLHISKERPDG